ncbi:MAG: CBS domain-containing protein [Cyanobacteria bacterium J06628_6]
MLTVRDIMTRPVIVIRSSATIENAIWLMRANRVRSLIVEEDYQRGPYGIITEKDIVYDVFAPGDNPRFVRVKDIMWQPCIVVLPDANLQEASQILADAGIHRAPVIENDQLLGIVSVTDILVKGHPGNQPRDELSERLQEALQHARILDDEEAQAKQECNIAWEILEDIRQSAGAHA